MDTPHAIVFFNLLAAKSRNSVGTIKPVTAIGFTRLRS